MADVLNKEQLQVVATPTNTYVAPDTSKAKQLLDSLGATSDLIQSFSKARQQDDVKTATNEKFHAIGEAEKRQASFNTALQERGGYDSFADEQEFNEFSSQYFNNEEDLSSFTTSVGRNTYSASLTNKYSSVASQWSKHQEKKAYNQKLDTGYTLVQSIPKDNPQSFLKGLRGFKKDLADPNGININKSDFDSKILLPYAQELADKGRHDLVEVLLSDKREGRGALIEDRDLGEKARKILKASKDNNDFNTNLSNSITLQDIEDNADIGSLSEDLKQLAIRLSEKKVITTDKLVDILKKNEDKLREQQQVDQARSNLVAKGERLPITGSFEDDTKLYKEAFNQEIDEINSIANVPETMGNISVDSYKELRKENLAIKSNLPIDEWKDEVALGRSMNNESILTAKETPEAIARGYARFTQLRSRGSAVQNLHLSTEDKIYYRHLDALVKFTYNGSEDALLRASKDLAKLSMDNDGDLIGRYQQSYSNQQFNEKIKSTIVDYQGWNTTATNLGTFEPVFRTLVHHYAQTFSPEKAIKLAKEDLEEDITVIDGFGYYNLGTSASPDLIRKRTESVAKAYATQLSDYGIDPEDVLLVPNDISSDRWLLINKLNGSVIQGFSEKQVDSIQRDSIINK